MRFSFIVAMLLFCSTSPSSAVELKGESFVIDKDVSEIHGGNNLRSQFVDSMLYETKNGDIAVYYATVGPLNPEGVRPRNLYFRLLNGDGSKKWKRTLIDYGRLADHDPSGVVDLAEGGVAVSYVKNWTQLFIQKLNNGSRVGKPTLAVSELSKPYQKIEGILFPTVSGGRLIWSKYYDNFGPNKSGSISLDSRGDTSGSTRLVSSGVKRIIQVLPKSYGFQITYSRASEKGQRRRAHSFSVQEFDQDAAPLGEISSFYRQCKRCPLPVMLALDGGNQLIATREWEDGGQQVSFMEIRGQDGSVVASKTKVEGVLGSLDRLVALPGGDFIMAYSKRTDVAAKTRFFEIKRFNQLFHQVGSVAEMEAWDILDILPLKSGDAAVAYFVFKSEPERGDLRGRFITP